EGLMARLMKNPHRRPAQAMVVILAVLAVLFGGIAILSYIVLSSQTEEARERRRDADEAQRQAESRAERAEAAQKQADQQRQRAEAEAKKANASATEQRLEATRLAATLALDRGLTQCDQGEAERGLLWLARGLEAAGGNPEFQGIVRRHLSA